MSVTLDIPEELAKLIDRYAADHQEDREGFLTRLLTRALTQEGREDQGAARSAALLSQARLATLWDMPEEDAAWAHL